MINQAPTIDANCPRCGYDQRGATATWLHECPLLGTCTECGLSFEWAELLNPNLSVPAWCVESHRNPFAFPLRVLRTLGRTMAPWRLWRGIQMTHPPRWGALGAYLLFLTAMLYVIFCFCIGLTCVNEWKVTATRPALVAGGAPVIPTPASSGFAVFLRSAALPFSSMPIDVMTIPARTINRFGVTVNAPAATFNLNSPIMHTRQYILRLIPFAMFLMLIPLTCMFAFAALPISRRRAKVRWTHLFRAMLYCYGLVWLAIAMTALMVGYQSNQMIARMFMLVAVLFWIASPFLLVGFWWATASLYLRMQHGVAVALSVTIIGILAPISLIGSMWAFITP